METSPCFNCPDRKRPTPDDPRTCHSSCKRYILRQEDRRLRKAKEAKEKEYNDYIIAAAKRCKKKK